MNKNCRFCQIIENRNNEEIIFENDNFIVITDKYRKTSVGSICLVIPKKHVKNILELPQNLNAELLEIIKLTSKAMQRAYNVKGIRIWTAVNKEAGQSIFYTHIHILACKSIFDRLIASFPGVYDLFVLKKMSSEKNFKLAEKIRKEIIVK
jgi:histidine triad (HIT) family protein